jgi:rhodanese-related sulfurtransferase
MHRAQKNQNKIFFAGFLLILVVIVWALVRPAVLKIFQKNGDSEEKINEEILKAPVIAPKDLFERIANKEKFLIIDLSTTFDFGRGHLAQAVNVPAGDLDTKKLDLLGTEKISSIVLVNQGGDVLEVARKTNELAAAGYVNAKYLQGGISAWQNQGYATVSGGNSPLDPKKIKMIDFEKLSGDLAGGGETVQFIDVRNKEEFDAGHIFGAVNISAAQIEKKRDSISVVKKIVIYGNGEDEAKKAAVALFDLDYFNAYVFSGGVETWKNAGGKLERN